MKILVFEYVTGGGLAGQVIPATFVAEGRMMLQALLDGLKLLPDLQLLLPLDERQTDISIPGNAQVFRVGKADDIWQLMPQFIAEADLVWPIAPESAGILAEIALQVKKQHKVLLLSDPETISVCADKMETYRCLLANAIPAVESRSLVGLTEMPFPQCVIKPIDGAGCEGSRIIKNQYEFHPARLNLEDISHCLIQPLWEGQPLSLSCLFKQGRGWLLCCNEQQVAICRQQFSLQACLVNIPTKHTMAYQSLINRIAAAMPGLWGYIGIDLIETVDQGPLILEINPRLTTSYVGIRRATGINVAEQVLQMLNAEPVVGFSNSQTIPVVIH